MKKRIMSNLLLKIISLVAAFLFWLIIINYTDPTTSRTFSDIPVEILNENVITTANQVYEIEDGDKVGVTVKGKRSFVETLTEDDFTATADLSELSKVNAVSIDVKLNKKTNSNVAIDTDKAVLKVKLEKRVTQKFKVEVEHMGELSENYVLGEMVAKPNIVEVSCGKSKFKKIDHVGVMVSLNGQSEDFESEYSPVLYDEYGDALDGTNVTFSNDRIKVSTQVLMTKELPVFVDVSGTPADGYHMVQTDHKPDSIRVSGTESAMAKAQSVKIPLSVEGAKKDVEKEIAIEKYLPQNVVVVGDVTTISVRCEIERNGHRTFTLTPTDIAVKNLPSNCTMEYEHAASKYAIIVQGPNKALEKLKLTDLGAYVDLANLSEGTHTLEVRFNTSNHDITISNAIKVKIILNMHTTSGNQENSDETQEESSE